MQEKSFVRTISVGMPRDVDFGGHVFRSAIIKHPVTGPVAVTKSGIEGNKPAVHPDAVYAFSAESYQYWADQLGVDPADWPDGFVGENLTIHGLDERNLALGDIIRVGDQVTLQVLGPRIPCFKLSWRLKQPDAFLLEFALSGRCGYYLQVLQEGDIQAGDRVEVIQREPDRILLTQVSQRIFAGGDATEEQLSAVLASPFLSETSALMLRSRKVKLQEKKLLRQGRWRGWRPFVVEHINDEADGIRSFYLSPLNLKSGDLNQKDNGDLAGYLPGQFLTLRLPGQDGTELIRTYTLSDYGREDNLYRISVKRQGEVSAILHNRIQPGDILDIKAPAGIFTLDRTRLEPVVMISAGIGITPLLSMAKAHAARGDESPSMFFIHCARNSPSQAFRHEVDAICGRSERFYQYYIYTEPAEGDVKDVDYHSSERLDLKHLEKIVGDTYVEYCGTRIDIPFVQSLFYICGPESFQTELVAALEAAGTPPEHIRTESFDATKGGPMGDTVESAQIQLTRSDKSLTWLAEDGLTLLELLEQSGIEADYGCRNGVCHACKCTVKSGSVHYDHAPKAMPEEGVALLCCAKPGSAELQLDL